MPWHVGTPSDQPWMKETFAASPRPNLQARATTSDLLPIPRFIPVPIMPVWTQATSGARTWGHDVRPRAVPRIAITNLDGAAVSLLANLVRGASLLA